MNSKEYSYSFVPLSAPLRLDKQTWPAQTVPVVTIICITYNHRDFIRDAIQGFLIQRTTFPVEILIHDDASNDGTADIVREFEAAYPDLIRGIYQRENQYSKRKKPISVLAPLLRGKYVATCEGDDYWTDSNKLEIQVNYLEQHPQCVISGHDAVVIDRHGNRIKNSVVRTRNRDFSPKELKKGKAVLPTASRVYRNLGSWPDLPYSSSIQGQDRFRLAVLGGFGYSHFHNEIIPSAYRLHPGGVCSSQDSFSRNSSGANTSYFLYLYFNDQKDKEMASYWRRKWEKGALKAISLRFIVLEIFARITLAHCYPRILAVVFGRTLVERVHSARKWLRRKRNAGTSSTRH